MASYRLTKSFGSNVELSANVVAVAGMFGLLSPFS